MNETNEIKKGHFNVFDALLILLVLAVVAAGFYYFWHKSAAPAEGAVSDGTVTLEYTVVYRYVPDYYGIHISEGDEVFLTSTKEPAGTVAAVSILNPTTYSACDKETGVYRELDYPGAVDVYVTVRSTVTKDGTVYQLGSESVAIGKGLALRTKLFARDAYVTAMKEVPSK